MIPPFLAAQQAFKDKTPLSANPHDKAAPVKPDAYPGDHQNWEAGWRFAYRVSTHSRKQRTKP